MADLNDVKFIGNLTDTPEIRRTASGKDVCSFTVATTRLINVADGTKEISDFHKCVVWGKRAEYLKLHGDKGARIFVKGRLQTRNWEGQDGNKRYITEVVVDEMGVFK